MEQVSTKSCVALVKTNRVCKYTLSVQKVCYSQHKYRDPSKKHHPVIIIVMSAKNESINLKLPKY